MKSITRRLLGLALALAPATAAAQPAGDPPAAPDAKLPSPADAAKLADAAKPDPPAAYVPPDFIADEPPLPAGAEAATAWRLDLAETLQLAVRHNLDIALERESVFIAHRSIDLARGPFEPVLAVNYRHGSSRVASASLLEGQPDTINRKADDGLGISYQQRFTTGLRLDVGVDGLLARSTAASDFDSFAGTNATVRVSQPLLRGFSLDLEVPKLSILRAHIASDRERHQLEIVVAGIIERTEGAYWDVVAALYRHDLEVRSARRAEEQLALTRRQIDAGVLPPSDLIGAESTLAQRELQQVQAEQAVDQAWDRLRQVMNLPRDQWSRPILPVERPAFTPGTSDAEEAMATALAHRPEREQLDLDVRDAAFAVRKADNDRLPQIDLGLSGNVSGAGEHAGDAISQLGGFDARGWQVMLDLTWTPLNRTAGAAADIQRSQQKIVAARRESALQAIWFEVKDAVRNQDSAARQVAAAARFRDLAARSLEIEQRKFLNGTSSNFLIAQRQEELAAAQVAELSALLSHQKATATLLHATGVLLTERGISLD